MATVPGQNPAASREPASATIAKTTRLTRFFFVQIFEDKGVKKALQGVQQGARSLPVPRRLLKAHSLGLRNSLAAAITATTVASQQVWDASSVLSWGSKIATPTKTHLTHQISPGFSFHLYDRFTKQAHTQKYPPPIPENMRKRKMATLVISCRHRWQGEGGLAEKKGGGSRICTDTSHTSPTDLGSHMVA